MALDLNAIQVIVYDLDGTVYDDIRHFELYAQEIRSHLPQEVQAPFWADYQAVLAGAHPALRIGTFYDVTHDLVLETRGGRVLRGLHWDGAEIPPVLRQQLYGDRVIVPDHDQIMNVGDLWWVPSAISAHYGGEAEGRSKSFLKIRDVMSAPEFQVESIPHLEPAIRALRGKVYQVLATNSPQPDSEAILRKVGLHGLFDQMYFKSAKPAGLRRIFEEIATSQGVPMAAILSVGDNLINEIAPARAMGCQTVYIDPHGTASPEEADLTVKTMTEFLPTLSRLAERKSS